MSLFVFIGHDGADGAKLRPDVRPAHLAHWAEADAEGRMIFAGPLKDGEGVPRGSVLIFEAGDYAAALGHCRNDPYVKQGVFDRFEVHHTQKVLPTR